jgi:hypothetical protein
MSSKRFKGLLCVYCLERKSVTGDHVFAREFFLPAQRSDLPQVPVCECCNNEKSRVEHYLTTLLPFGGRHSDSTENLKKQVPKRLERNHRLHSELRQHHHGANPIKIEVLTLTDRGRDFFQRNFFSLRSANRALVSLGNRSIIYEGIQAFDCPQITVWRFHIYGGLILGGDDAHVSTEIGAMSGPKSVMQCATF